MGLLDRFIKGPELSREPELRDRETILAYFEEMARTRQTMMLTQGQEDPIPHQATVQRVDDEKMELTLGLRRALDPELHAKAPLTLIFALDGHRFQAPVKYVGRGGYLQIVATLPEKIMFAERRTRLRAKFGAREKASVTVLQGLFEGTGAAGKLVNLSMEGLCLQVQRAIQVQSDKRIKIDENLFAPGEKVLLVRILDLPQIPTVECSGTVCWLHQGAEGLLVGVQLWGLGGQEATLLERVMTRRLPTFTVGFPVRRRRGAGSVDVEGPDPSALDGDPEAGAMAQDDDPDRFGEEGSEVGLGEAQAQVAAGPPEAGEGDGDPTAAPAGSHARDRLIQWRRRSKQLMVIMADDLDRAILAGTLQVDGYVAIHEARSLVQALERAKKHLPDLIIVDHQVGPHLAPDIILKLRSLGTMDIAPVVVLQNRPDMKLLLGLKPLRIKHVLPKPVDYDGVLKPLLDRLLDLQ